MEQRNSPDNQSSNSTEQKAEIKISDRKSSDNFENNINSQMLEVEDFFSNISEENINTWEVKILQI